MPDPEFIEYRPGQFFCPQCKTPLPLEMRQEGSRFCGACWSVIENQKNVKTVDSAVVAAAQSLLTVNSEHRGSVRADLAMGAFMDGIGGEQAFGSTLAAKFRQVVDHPETTAKEKRIWLFQTMKFAQKQQELDRERQPDLSDIPEDELLAMLRPLAVQAMLDNPAFREEVLSLVVDSEARHMLEVTA